MGGKDGIGNPRFIMEHARAQSRLFRSQQGNPRTVLLLEQLESF